MKLLMHMCCAPCSTYPFKFFKSECINVTGLFYNPNIHPLDEYHHRLDTVKAFAYMSGLEVKYLDGYMEDEWLKYKDTDSNRCMMCYRIRLEKTALYAKEMGYDAFTTSLLVSPYQKHELIKQIGKEMSLKYDIEFYYKDFRPYFREGQAIAKELNLYRQKYCGCIVSFNSRNTILPKKN